MIVENFDPLEYIEKAFDEAKDSGKGNEKATKSDGDVKVPTIGEYIKVAEPRNPYSAGAGTKVKSEASLMDQPKKVRFQKRNLSAPRPRRVKNAVQSKPVDPEVQEVWQTLPKFVNFLSSFFDDTVTANYYRGEFKESRQELIRRLLDPELTLEEVSRLLGVCPATVRRYTNRGWLKHHRTKGRQRRFRLSGVVMFVEQHGRHPQE